MPRHIALLIPGLSDTTIPTKVLHMWNQEGIEVIMHSAMWKNRDESYDIKLDRLIKHVDALAQKNVSISLIGTSAGGSLVINAFAKRKAKIHRVVSICGRIKKGKKVFPSLSLAAKGYNAFYDSVVACEETIKVLSAKDKEKIMTISPFLLDIIVPYSCIKITGAHNTTVPIPYHTAGIAIALTLWRKHIADFILYN